MKETLDCLIIHHDWKKFKKLYDNNIKNNKLCIKSNEIIRMTKHELDLFTCFPKLNKNLYFTCEYVEKRN